MSYYFSKIKKDTSFDKVIEGVIENLKKEGFGVLTEIDVKETLKKNLTSISGNTKSWVLAIRPLLIVPYKLRIRLE
jgi:uncharacterized protein (DUF302 family)